MQEPFGDLPVLPEYEPEFLGLRISVRVLPACSQDAPSFSEGVSEWGGDFVEDGVGLFHRVAWAVDEGVESLLEAQGELVPVTRRDQFRAGIAIGAVGAGAGLNSDGDAPPGEDTGS
ncbi:hypothetical protein ACFVXW_24755 [Streptomyces sp. NPDC058251]|uniref:hypothetical protein n=1 Tax=unclassified Streptomyces TaxID=2593676 RepID=UPI0036EC41AB